MKQPYQPISEEHQALLKNMRQDVARKYGIDKIYPANARYFGSYTIMVAILSCLQVFVVLYGEQIFEIHNIALSTGWFFLLPILQYIFQIVTEVYGWEYARQLVLANFICNGLATLIYFAFHLIKFSTNYANLEPFVASSIMYNSALSAKYMYSMSLWFGMFVSDYITCLLMSWSKFQMQGKFMITRIAILHIVSEILLQSGAFVMDHFRGIPVSDTLHLILQSFTGRTIMMVALLPIAKYVIWMLQYRVEKIIVYDFKRELLIFRLNINPLNSFYVKTNKSSSYKVLDKRDTEELIEMYRQEFEEKYANRSA